MALPLVRKGSVPGSVGTTPSYVTPYRPTARAQAAAAAGPYLYTYEGQHPLVPPSAVKMPVYVYLLCGGMYSAVGRSHVCHLWLVV